MTLPLKVETPLVNTRLPELPSKKCGVWAADASTPSTPSESQPYEAPNVNFLLPLPESSVRRLVEPARVVPTNGVNSQSAAAGVAITSTMSDRIHARRSRPYQPAGRTTDSLINRRTA